MGTRDLNVGYIARGSVCVPSCVVQLGFQITRVISSLSDYYKQIQLMGV